LRGVKQPLIVIGNFMRTILIIFLFAGLCQSSWGSCSDENRTLTERLFQGKAGTIFTCKVLTFSTPTYPDNIIVSNSDNSIDGTATVEIITVYFGNVDTNIVTLRAGSYMKVGMTYLIYTGGSGRVFSFGGNCDRLSKQVNDIPATTNELSILKQFSDIFKNKISGQFTFKNYKNIVIAEGQFAKGKPIKVWKHYFDNGKIKAEYNLKTNTTSQYYENGFIKNRSTTNKNVGFYEQFSEKINGQLTFTDKEVKKDTLIEMTVTEYYDNGSIKNISSQLNIIYKGGSVSSIGKTGEYKEYYENGNLKLQGQYKKDKRIGIWKWYHANGEFNTEFDYKDGTGKQ